MNIKAKYLIDANVLIEAKKRYYSFKVCPGFWDSILWHHEKGNIRSIDRVHAECAGFGDELSDWVEDVVPKDFFETTDQVEVIDQYGQMQTWVGGHAFFLPVAKTDFAATDRADAWLIAHAKANGYILVTDEKLNRDKRNKVLIPNVCEQFDIKCIGTFAMLEALTTRFTWSHKD